MYSKLLLMSLFLAACGAVRVGSGVPATERVEIDDPVRGFVNRTWVDATVRQGPTASVEVTCDDNLIDEIVVTWDEDGVIELKQEWPGVLNARMDCVALVVVPELVSVGSSASGQVVVEGDHDALGEIRSTGSGGVSVAGAASGVASISNTGSGDMVIDRVAGCEVAIDATGSGGVDIGDLQACTLNVSQTGSGDVNLTSGDVEELDLDVLGSGDFMAEDLVVERANLFLTGSGSAEVTVTEAVKVRILGSGDAIIHGQPQGREVQTLGSGEVEFL